MKISSKRLTALTGLILWSILVVPAVFAATPTLSLTINPAPPGGTTTATVAILDAADAESFSLELNFSSGTSLALSASGWFARGAAFPSVSFGASSPVELNSSFESIARTKVYMDGFRPAGTSGAIGSVTFAVSSAALNGDTQVLSLSGQYLSKTLQSVNTFGTATAVFTAGNNPDLTPPNTTITNKPANPSNNAAASFSFTATEANSTFECKLDSGSFVACTSPKNLASLAAGSHTFAVRATDPAGNTDATPASYTWTIDLTSTDVTINAKPENPSSQKTGTISFSSSDTAATYECKLDSDIFAVCASPYSYTNLGDTSHTFTVKANGLLGNVSVATHTWNIDTDLPNLNLSTLADGSVTNNNTLNISGTVNDTSGIKSLSINNTPVIPDAGGNFSYPVTLNSGVNSITIVATDNAGNQTTDTRTITLDPTVPVLTITVPADNSKINKPFVDVTGSVDENSTVELKVNNGSAQSATMNGTSFVSTVNLVSGINTIDITATDLAGNPTNAKRTVTSDTEAPSLAVTDPAQDITTDQSSITISGTVADALTAVTISINFDGQSYTSLVENGGFTQTITLTEAKTYAVTVTASDEAGNQTSVQRNIIYVKTTASGDISGDGTVTISDALMALRIAVGLIPMDAKYLADGDVSPYVNNKPQPDGNINISDALVILRKCVGLINW